MILDIPEEVVELSNLLYIETVELLDIILRLKLPTQISLLGIEDAYDINLLMKANDLLSKYKGMRVVGIVDEGSIRKRFKVETIQIFKEEL